MWLPNNSVAQEQRHRKGKQPKNLADIYIQESADLSTPPTSGRKYSLKLIISHFDTPFKHEVAPHTEGWIPTTEELGYGIYGVFLTTESFGEIGIMGYSYHYEAKMY